MPKMLQVLLGVLCMILGANAAAKAQCANSAALSCGVYNSCFAKYCRCDGNANEYFLSYGRKYCDRFLGRSDWSAAGQRWRDNTLLCLQESIVPKLDISAKPTCDCKAMKDFAFKSHVSCYTQAGASICNLPLSDFRKIYDIIDVGDDLFKDPYGRAQMRQVLQICRSDPNSTVPKPVLEVIELIFDKLK